MMMELVGPLADSRLRKPLGDRAKLADPTPIERGSRNRDEEIDKPRCKFLDEFAGESDGEPE